MDSKIIFRPLHLNSKIFINRHGFEFKSITVPRQALTVGKLSTNTTFKSTSALDNGQSKTNGNSNAKKDTSDQENDVELKPLTDQGEIVKVVQPKPPPPPSTISVNESRYVLNYSLLIYEKYLFLHFMYITSIEKVRLFDFEIRAILTFEFKGGPAKIR